MKTIGININDIVRNFLGKFHFLHGYSHSGKEVELEVEYINGWSKKLVEEQNSPLYLHTKLKITESTPKGDVIVIPAT